MYGKHGVTLLRPLARLGNGALNRKVYALRDQEPKFEKNIG